MGVLTEDASICGAINREDVAELVVKAIFSEKANGKVGSWRVSRVLCHMHRPPLEVRNALQCYTYVWSAEYL